jgi:hypothetical protein
MAHAPLHPDARFFLAREVGLAREIAEKGARASLTALVVAEKVVPAHFTEAQRKLRNRLRAHARQLGDERTADGQQEVNLLTEEVAYQHWHRMLFARFLAENELLREDEGDQPIDLDECRALAADRRLDIWVYAALCAQKMLPGVFRLDDPALELKLDGAAQVELNGLMAGLQPEIFKATDALGWVYQYWQAKRKDEVNASGVKIGAKEISPVTQLFTEDYMVDFLLHNTLGAWWAGKMGPIEAATEEEARARAGLAAKDGLAAVVWTYLRFIQDSETKKWTPAGGTFDGWPKRAKDITFLDPCMGSGHFPVFALPILARMRMEEEHGTAAENIHVVLKDQIHGLELDQRCCQIGAFNLALSAWKLAGYQQLPVLNVACCGLSPAAQLKDWVSLAGDNQKLQRGMERLHRLFQKAAVLGSLINPRVGGNDLLEAGFHELQPLLEKALVQEAKDDNEHEMAVAARGLAKAAEILAGQFTLVATNVPYLGAKKQDDVLKDYCERVYPYAKGGLATCFIERCLTLCGDRGNSTALVTPQSWLFLGSFTKLRQSLLRESSWNMIARLGPKAFQTPMWDFNIGLLVFTFQSPSSVHKISGLDVSALASPPEKANALTEGVITEVGQLGQLNNPDSVITSVALQQGSLLNEFATAFEGAKTVDITRFRICFWEAERVSNDLWWFHNSSPSGDTPFSGCEYLSSNRSPDSAFQVNLGAYEACGIKVVGWECGKPCWSKKGIAVSWMGKLPASLYVGSVFDNSAAVIIPKREADLPAVYAFLASSDYLTEIRKINQNVQVAAGTLDKVPFDLAHWQKVASAKYPDGLPKPFSSDPTQWLFNGHPNKSDNPLQVAVARLLCYQWPRQTGSSFTDCPALGADGLENHTDDDGIVALSSINREEAAAPRVRALLKDAYGSDWHDGVTERQILADAGHGDSTLEEWLRDSFFEEHCKLFHHRPFVWHIWDGERDGFHVLVNYHRLAAGNGEGARLLQKLAQTYLGDWIARCEADVKNDKPNAYKLLKAAKDLQADLLKILEGEAPHDIFVRWKPLHEQSIGWNPDINDGVRLNIRPFLTVRDVGKKGAGLLRWKPNIKWDKDRGSEPERPKAQFPWFWSCLPEDKPEHVTDFAGGTEFTGERWNNLHYSLATKKAARAKFSPKK